MKLELIPIISQKPARKPGSEYTANIALKAMAQAAKTEARKK